MDYGNIIVAISAAITLLGVIFNLFKSNRISDKAVDRTSEAEKTLSAEHKGISATQIILLERTADSKASVQKIATAVEAIDRRMVLSDTDRKLQFASLDAKHQMLVKSADDIGKFSEEFLKLSADYVTMQKEMSTLRAENEALRQELAREKRQGEWEPEL